ncbi:phage holin family protein [Modestobacter sp. NPDC049651]|uniref:phage holin family protein n=1 Tax=unclassified Modestobacter TaxID=2643866 RepID=UPI0033D6B8B7
MAHSAPVHPLVETAGSDRTSVGNLVKSATADLSTLIRGEIELAKAEVGTSVKRGGVGAAAFAAAGVLLAFAGFFFFFFLAELLAEWLPRWAAFLIVTGLLVLIAAVAGLIGYRFFKRIEKPEKTIETLHDLPDVMRRQAPGRREHDLPTVRNGHVERADPHARLG